MEVPAHQEFIVLGQIIEEGDAGAVGGHHQALTTPQIIDGTNLIVAAELQEAPGPLVFVQSQRGNAGIGAGPEQRARFIGAHIQQVHRQQALRQGGVRPLGVFGCEESRSTG